MSTGGSADGSYDAAVEDVDVDSEAWGGRRRRRTRGHRRIERKKKETLKIVTRYPPR